MNKESYEGFTILEIMAKARNYNRWMFHTIRPYLDSRILEIGAGIGSFSWFLRAREYLLITEMAADCYQQIIRYFSGASNIEIRRLDITQLTQTEIAEIKSKEINCIVCLNVLEHIKDDLEALRNMRNLIQKGRLICLVPAVPFVYGLQDRLLGHYRRYSRWEIKQKMMKTGWRVERIFYFNSLGVILWFLLSRLFKQPTTEIGKVLFYDRLVVPWLSKIERTISPPWGQSLVAIGVA